MERGEASRWSGRLEAASDDELRALVPPGAPRAGSWADSGPVEVDGTTLFAKRIPVTDLEAERWPSTSNHFGLPLRYQYGVGSAGFGVAREAATWAYASDLADRRGSDGVTTLLHQRLLARTGEPWSIPLGREEYVSRWGGDAAIARFVDARVAASHALWLVGEHLPHTALAWLAEHQDRVGDLVDSLLATLALLRDHEMAHFDAHLGNVVVDDDGERFCLVDFGLASAAVVDLTDEERAFLASHRHYDAGELLFSLSLLVGIAYRGLDEAGRARALSACGVGDPDDRAALLSGLIDHADRLSDEGLVDLHPGYVAALGRYRDVILYMDAVLGAVLTDGDEHRYDDAELVGRLVSCGALASA